VERLTGALGVATVGLPKVFFIPAAFAFLAVLGHRALAGSYLFLEFIICLRDGGIMVLW
jgi:hypothetical protein